MTSVHSHDVTGCLLILVVESSNTSHAKLELALFTTWGCAWISPLLVRNQVRRVSTTTLSFQGCRRDPSSSYKLRHLSTSFSLYIPQLPPRSASETSSHTRLSMGDDDPSLFRGVNSKTSSALGLQHDKDTQPILPQHETRAKGPAEASRTPSSEKPANTHLEPEAPNVRHVRQVRQGRNGDNDVQDQAAVDNRIKEANSTIKSKPKHSYTRIKDGTRRFLQHTKNALLYSWINVLLVFVPIGIAAHFAHLSPEIVFSMNALAIIPLAGLLSHATEAVATRLGDTLGALLNVSFGNAVELILFIILLADNQIRVVQAALLGSILANLLLIMGMAFLLGGLRYQEQVSRLPASYAYSADYYSFTTIP